MSHSIVYECWTFPADKIKEGNLYLATSLLGSSLEVNSFVPVVECDDPAILDFQRNAKLLYYAEPDRPMVFRVQSIKRAAHKLYEITATSTLGLLMEGQHMGGVYTGQEAEEVILDICGTVPVEIKNNLKKTKLYGWLPIAAPRDNLAQVLFAIGAALKTDLDGVLRIEGLWDGIAGQVPQDNMYTDANVDYSARITQVIVTEHQYVSWTEEQLLFEGTAQAGDVITFDEPMHDLAATGFTILANGANWARVSAGSGTLIGKTYIHNTRQVSRAVQEASSPNVKTVEDATLVSLANSAAVAQRLADYYKCRERIDAPVVYQGESPGDRLAAWHPFDKTGVAACLESADITLSNTLKAEEKLLVGYVPPQMGDVEYFDYSEIITRDGEWEAPEGVTTITVVCIGGGWGGYSGYPGNAMSYPPPTLSEGNWTGYNPGYGANGGQGGAVGSGGRIVIATLDVTKGQKFPHKIGAGGKGGSRSSSGSNVGTEGGATTFGPVTSADGSPSPAGYTDIITGETYAKPGDLAGIAGGRGSGGKSSNVGYEYGTTVTDRQGRVWSPGNITSNSENVILEGRIQVNGSWTTDYVAQAGRGCGGGPAVGANGSNGGYGSTSSSQYTPFNAYGGASGNGADAIKAENQTKRGCGGNGGHGGGGEGGTGLACHLKPWTGNASVSRGRPGYGGEGGDGGDGIIILYYARAKKAPAGQLVDKNNKMVLDRLGRRIIM